MTLKDITLHRLHAQQLAKQKFTTPGEVVSWMGAVQGQDYFGALWSIGQRMKKAIEADVEKATIDRSIIRTWPMRGTLHFVAPQDIRWMLKYLTPRIISRSASLYKQASLEKKDLTKSARVLEKTLQGGKQLTRDELYDVLERAKISTGNVRGLHILGHLAMQGLICFGARKGKQQTFALLEEWVPPAKMLEKDEALGELALRYFRSHGPATIEDFMWWAGLTKADATIGLALIEPELEKEIVEDRPYWFYPSGKLPKINSSTAYLLPTYDEYGIAYKDRSAIVDAYDYKKIGGPFTSAIIMNGKVIGIWRRTLKKDTALIETKPFSSFSKAQVSAIGSVTKKYSKFIGMDCELKI